jgi:hypothetical protein
MNVVVSIATIPKRIEYFSRSFSTFLKQTAIGKVSAIYVNVNDDVNDDELALYDYLKDNPLVKVVKRDSKWRSANKLVWTYMEHMDDVIVTFDDDKDYPLDCLEELLEAYEKSDKRTVITEESNPTLITADGNVEFRNNTEVAFGQLCFSKYFSNGCLFPPRCFGDGKLLTDYDRFYEMTRGQHDELWFWLVTTLNKVRSIRLNSTYSYAVDGCSYPLDDCALTRINCKAERVKEYNAKVNEMFGDELVKVFDEVPVSIPLNRLNYEAVLFAMPYIYTLYGNFKVEIVADEHMRKSHLKYIEKVARKHVWKRGCNIKAHCV